MSPRPEVAVPPHNKTLQTDEIWSSRGRECAAGALCALRVADAGGSRDLATISDTLAETLSADFAAERQIRYAFQAACWTERRRCVPKENGPKLKLPKSERSTISPEKLQGYLLSTEHPIGRFKARFFHALGYTPENWEILASDLLEAARTLDAEPVPSPYGEKFRIVGRLTGPNGRSAEVISVWIASSPNEAPRFITAYPVE